MSRDKRTAKDDAIYLRRFRALELRVKGEKTIREIANECGVSVGTAWKDIQWMSEHETADRGEYISTYREVESQRLDEWQARLLTSLSTISDIDDQAKVFGVLMKISERRSKLLGLDAPIRTEIDATVSSEATPAAARQYMQELFTTGLKPPSDGDESSN